MAGAAPIETTAGIVRRLEDELARARGDAPPILALDADGTLWTGDVGIDLFTALLASGDVREAARDALAVEAEAAGVDDPGPSAPALARALFDAFLEERYAEDRAFGMMAWAFAGWTEAEMAAFARRVAAERALAERIRPGMTAVLRWADDRGVEALLVSASPRAIVEVGASHAGIAPRSVLAMTPAVEGGRLLARLGGPATYGEGKIRAIRAARPGAPLVAAFGDGAWDVDMLRAAAVPVAVWPSERLLARAGEVPGLSILEA
jgi:phosphoserine phosphatase